MARVTVVYWQEIPSMVEAREGRARHKVALSARFQELIDTAAMRRRLAGTDAYLLQWSRGEPVEHAGEARAAAEAVAAGIEARYDAIRDEALARCRT